VFCRHQFASAEVVYDFFEKEFIYFQPHTTGSMITIDDRDVFPFH